MSERASTGLSGRNRPDWRAPRCTVTANAKPPANPWPLGRRPWPDAMRCVAIARMTGQRCQNARMQGASVCHKHGGYCQTYATHKAHGHVFVSLAYLRRPRRALAELGAVFGDASEPSIIERGRQVERTGNHVSCPHKVRDTETEPSSDASQDATKPPPK
jgi:hypothetical protein